MHGERPGKAWMLLNLGDYRRDITKAADDGTQLILEALVSTATDASTAGTAKIVSTSVSAIFMLTRHGRDVVLPKYTQMKIVFDRPVKIPTQAQAQAPWAGIKSLRKQRRFAIPAGSPYVSVCKLHNVAASCAPACAGY